MGRKFRIQKRKLLRAVRKHRLQALLAVCGIVVAIGFLAERSFMDANYSKLLTTIAEGESRGNYNAYFSNAQNTAVRFTEMTVQEVLDWQLQFVEQGSPSNAVGKYQFIRPTLLGLVEEMNIDRTRRFDSALQDQLAIQLLKRRGVEQYLRGAMTREEFAHNLSKEWAALPRVVGKNPEQSYYAGDGLNHVQISVDELLASIDALHATDKS